MEAVSARAPRTLSHTNATTSKGSAATKNEANAEHRNDTRLRRRTWRTSMPRRKMAQKLRYAPTPRDFLLRADFVVILVPLNVRENSSFQFLVFSSSHLLIVSFSHHLIISSSHHLVGGRKREGGNSLYILPPPDRPLLVIIIIVISNINI